MKTNARRRTKLPASVEIPNWAVKEINSLIGSGMVHSGQRPYQMLYDWNVKLRGERHGVYISFPGSYQGKAAVQFSERGSIHSLNAESGDSSGPLVAYVVSGGSYDVPISNVRLYVKWQADGAGGYYATYEVAEHRPDLDARLEQGMRRLRERHYTPNPPPRPPPPRRSSTMGAPPPPPRGPASILTSVRRMVTQYDGGFDPERHRPLGVKRHHFMVNGASRRTPSQQLVDHFVAENFIGDPEVMAELYMEKPNPVTALLNHMNYLVNEALVAPDGGEPYDVVCRMGLNLINKIEVNEEIQEQLPHIVEQARKAAEMAWPGDPEVAQTTAKIPAALRKKASRPRAPARASRGRKAPAAASSRGVALPERILAVFDELNAKRGHRNYVQLFEMREALPDVSRSEFDRAIDELRRRWVLTLDPAEGRHERVSPEVLDAGIQDQGSLLVYAARRDPD